MAGSKFRAASLEAISNACNFLQAKLNNEIDYGQSLHRRKNRNDIRLNSNFGCETRNRRDKRRSTSITQTYLYSVRNSSKRLTSEIVANSQLHSKQALKVVLNTDDA